MLKCSDLGNSLKAVVFVVDAADRGRMCAAREALYKILSVSELRETILLVFANKKDLDGALSVNDIIAQLGLNALSWQKWHILPTCSLTGEGLEEGLRWISRNIKYQ